MLEETYAKSGARPDVEGLRRLALLHDIGKELLN
jgi:HD superfamily phosphodiesterase